MIYLDTNVLLSVLLTDSTTTAAETWMAQQTASLAISTWSIAEFHGNVALRARKKEIPSRMAAEIFEEFDTDFSGRVTTLPVTDAAHQRAAHWLRSPDCALQTADALHLAIALEYDAAAIVTFDHRFARGIEKLRIAGLKVIALPMTNAPHKIQQKPADYNVTERDIAKAVKWARKRKTAERANTPRLTVRG